jgi:transmembrane sensor
LYYQRNTQRKDVEKDKKYQEIISNWQTPFTEDNTKSWESIQDKIAAQPETKVVGIQRWWYAAASVAAMVALVWMLLPNATLTQVAQLEKSTAPYTLPDGSTVWLNASSTMEFDADQWSEERSLKLTGEAFFQVQKGSEFTVSTASGEVTVLGTSFNVYSRGSDFEVDCFTGKVRVADKSSSVELTPGERAIKASAGIEEIVFVGTDQPGWKSGNYEYVDAPVQRVFSELELQTGVKVVSDLISDMTFTGEFNIDNLEVALATICLPLDLNFEIEDDMTVVISRN